MDRSERLKMAYEYLRFRGMVHTQKDLAEKMQATPPHVSSALKGDVRFLTDKFLQRFNHSFEDIFNLQWLILGEGNMLKEEEDETEFEQSETSRFLSLLEKKDEQMDRLIALLELKYSTGEKKERDVG